MQLLTACTGSQKSNKYQNIDLREGQKERVFIVLKKDRSQHVVNFGKNSTEQMPSSSCKDWIRWHIPCKHFFAVFQLTQEWNWGTLPQTYRDSAYLSTDNEATDKHSSQFASLPTPAAGDVSHSVLLPVLCMSVHLSSSKFL